MTQQRREGGKPSVNVCWGCWTDRQTWTLQFLGCIFEIRCLVIQEFFFFLLFKWFLVVQLNKQYSMPYVFINSRVLRLEVK